MLIQLVFVNYARNSTVSLKAIKVVLALLSATRIVGSPRSSAAYHRFGSPVDAISRGGFGLSKRW